MNIRLLSAPSFLGLVCLASACDGNGPGNKDDDTGGDNDDTGEISYDEGCIVLDGGQTFAFIEDALTVAGEGSTLSLEGCGDAFDQQAVVTKGVALVGPGAEAMVWTAPVNKPAIEISGASGASVSGFTFTSTRDGIVVESSTDTALANLGFKEIANTAIVTRNSTGTSVVDSSFVSPSYGAVQVDNGTATLERNDVENPLGFGFRSTDGSTITANGNTVTGTMYTNLDNGLIDGFAFWGEGGGFVTDGNVLTDNIIGMLVEEADLDSHNDTVNGGLYGIYALFGELSVDGATVTNPTQFAIVLASQNDPVSLTNSSVYGDPEVVQMFDDPDAWADNNVGSVLLQTDGVATVEGLILEGYNAQGLAVQDYSSGGEAFLTDVQITSPGRYGLILADMDVVMEDVQIDDLRLVDDPTMVNLNYSFSVGYGLLIVRADVQWTGGGVSNSDPINMLAQQASLTFDDIDVVGGEVLGLWSISSSLVLTNSTITDSPSFGGVANYSGDLVLDGNTFVDNQKTQYTRTEGRSLQYISSGDYIDSSYGGAWTSGTSTFTDATATFVSDGYQAGDIILPLNYGYYVDIVSVDSETQLTLDLTWSSSSSASGWYGYRVLETYVQETYNHYYSQDVVGSGASSMSITNNTFTDGSNGIYIDAGEVVIEDNTWTNYNSSAIRLVGVEGAEVKDNTINNIGGDGFYCASASVEVEDLAINSVLGEDYWYERYRDGVLDYSYQTTFNGPAMYLSGCTVTFDGLTIDGANEQSIVSYDSALEFYDVAVTEDESIANSGYGAVQLSWSSTAPSLQGSEVTITSQTMGDALILSNSNTDRGDIYVEDLTIAGSSDDGIVLRNVSAEFPTLRVDDANDNGVEAVSSDLTVSDATISANGCAGISGQGVDAQSLTSGSGGVSTQASDSFTDAGATFSSAGVLPGDRILISTLRSCPFVVSEVSDENTLVLTEDLPSSSANLSYTVMTAGSGAVSTTVTIDGLVSTDNVYGVYLDSVTADLSDLSGSDTWQTSCGASVTATCSNTTGPDYGCCPL